MKRIALIFFLILFSFCVFAESLQIDTIVIRTSVSAISLSQALAASDGMLGLYKLTGSFDLNTSGSDYILADDISRNDITAYFRVDQLAKTRTDETIQLSIFANSLVNSDADTILSQDGDAKTKTGMPTIDIISYVDVSALQVTSVPKNENEIVFILRYMDYKPLENINIVTFKTTWDKTTGLAPGLYTSSVTLSYIMN